jgi:anti-anti-sigma factor
MDHAPVLPGILDLSIRRRGSVVELALVGDLDSATVHRLDDAVTWLRHSTRGTEVVLLDTTAVAFVSAAGYRALHAALAAWDDRPGTRVVSIAGAAAERIEAAVAAIATAGDRPARRAIPATSRGGRAHLGTVVACRRRSWSVPGA